MTAEASRLRDGSVFRFPYLATLSFALLLAGCLQGDEPAAVERVGVSGEVFLDGKPLEAAAIVFESRVHEGEGAVLSHGFVEQGRYRIDAVQGPVVGKCRVSFLPKPLQREEYEAKLDEAAKRRRAAAPTVVAIPEEYRVDSRLEVVVVGGKENQLDFRLESEP